jgi:glucokinase
VKHHESVLALDIGGSKMAAAIVDAGGVVHGRGQETLTLPYTQQDVLAAAARLGCGAMHGYKGSGPILGIGAAIPGLADPANGTWVYSSFSGIRDFPFAALLTKALHLPVSIENDVNACALGEMRFGACTDVNDFLWVTVSNGIGGSIVANGKLYGGAGGNAGEIGHICVEEDGPLCQCGKRGCLEACAAGPAILRRYLALTGLPDDPALHAKAIAGMARQGDPAAQKAYDQTGRYLGIAIAAAVNLLNPQKVILGGGVSLSFDLFYPRLQATLDQMVFRQANGTLRVERTALGYDAALLGAAAVGLRGLTARVERTQVMR